VVAKKTLRSADLTIKVTGMQCWGYDYIKGEGLAVLSTLGTAIA
jgi:hypothetical protein